MSDVDPENTTTLYNPDTDGTEVQNGSEFERDGNTSALEIEMPSELARKIQTISNRIGLPAPLIVVRAIQLVTREVKDIKPEELSSPDEYLDQYQARIGLLEEIQKKGKLPDDEEDWRVIDEMIDWEENDEVSTSQEWANTDPSEGGAGDWGEVDEIIQRA